MFESDTGPLRVAGLRRFWAFPISAGRLVEVRPKREFEFQSRTVECSDDL
jgi:hypothetical protein